MIAINCGGEEYQDENGILYQADEYFNGGTPSDFGIQYEIGQTKDEDLYQTERWSDKDLIYNLPIDAEPAKYILILKFSEVYFTSAEEKVFNIALGSKIVVQDLDVFDRVGKAKAHDEFIEFEIKEDGLYYNVSFMHII